MPAHLPDSVDVLVVGGGINGVGIARDAAGRGLSVLLVERGDLGCATSSASSKLIHGGLRYLEHFEFRLVAEALAEREVLLAAAPHIVHPMRFVMPHVPELRPAWMIRAGLLLYDYLARRQTLPASQAIDLRHSVFGAGLKNGVSRAFLYSDCRVDDARLVVLTARAASDLGAKVLTRTTCSTARRDGKRWRATLRFADGAQSEVAARALVNATGPWAKRFLVDALRMQTPFNLKLVQGSHIVVPKLYEGDHAYILQNDDRRVIFVYGYEDHYTLIGTTEVEVSGSPESCAVSEHEMDYLVRAANRYFDRELSLDDVVWSYCGIRPLFDDGSTNPSAISRDYELRIDGDSTEAPVLTVFGGKITTYRRLAEQALEKLAPWFRDLAPTWTARVALPGGDLAEGLAGYVDRLSLRYPELPRPILVSLARRHGTLTSQVLESVRTVAQLGEHFGAELYAREVEHFVRREWARTAEDVLWRRTKAGLHIPPEHRQTLAHLIAELTSAPVR